MTSNLDIYRGGRDIVSFNERGRDFEDSELTAFLDIPPPVIKEQDLSSPPTAFIDMRGATNCHVYMSSEQQDIGEGDGGSFKLWMAVTGACLFAMVCLTSYAVVTSLISPKPPTPVYQVR